MANPFVAGGTVTADQLIGRVKDLNAVFDKIGRGHLAINASSGMGKSSLLAALNSKDVWETRGKTLSDKFVLRVNCQDLYPYTPAKLWKQIIEQIHAVDAAYPTLREKTTGLLGGAVAQEQVLQTFRDVEGLGKGVLLLLDDYDAALETNAGYTESEMLTHLFGFRSIANDTQLNRYACIVATSRRLSDLGPRREVLPAGSPWYNQYTFRTLKSFTRTEIDQLIGRMPPRFYVNELVRDGIVELAGGNPALVQYACAMLHEAWEGGAVLSPDAFSREFESNTRQYYTNAWRFSSPTEQLCLMLIALSKLDGRVNGRLAYDIGDFDALLSQHGPRLSDLEGRGVIEREGDGETYRFCSSIMEWWVVKEIENSKDQAELDQREKILLGLSRAQVEQVKGVLKQVWEQKEALKSVVGYVGKLVGAFGKGAVAG